MCGCLCVCLCVIVCVRPWSVCEERTCVCVCLCVRGIVVGGGVVSSSVSS